MIVLIKRIKEKKIAILFLVLLGTAFITGCKKDDDPVPVDREVKEYVWSAMNIFYYWQSEVPNLADSKRNAFSFYSFLDSYETPETFFDALLYEKDRFSWIVDDYEELEAAFQGISESFGYSLGLLRLTSGSDDLLAYIKYVIPGSPAELAGLKRGDLFTTVNGSQLTVSNYNSLLFGQKTITIRLADILDNTLVQTDTEITMTAIQLSENPILISDVIAVDTDKKVGYLVYNQFINNNTYHEELNEAFGMFLTEGISDLVLDLRYNGGGSLTTSRILASMIYGNATSNDVLGTIIYNQKLEQFNSELSFLTEVPVLDDDGNQTGTITMNRLNINRIFILTSGSTASASEFIIAGLLPYMDVTLIGTQTVGKNVGSVTLYDSEDFLKSETLNPNHKYAIQPIISQLANSVGFTDYIDGFAPDIEVNELDFLDDLKPLGSPEEPLLAEALSIISMGARKAITPTTSMRFELLPAIGKTSETILLDVPEVKPSIENIMW